ncbi:SAM-dependent methyltransferase [Tianweitania sediminis]|uniref:SAM-dependent methyltransferase n=1 Tax=Tianweitania sediminis TaxID=1502156 RepID=UPI001FD7D2CF|nr:SAM-dependent methyltransferase [Tianweitania sediminis]
MNVAVSADASDLAATVERARALLDDGDVFDAKMLASAAYEQAKLAGKLAERMRAGERLVAKARRLQGDALLIETRAKIRIAAEWDAAQDAGEAATRGRPKNVPDENVFTAEEAGLTRKEIHEARKLAAAEEREPGIVERAIAARIEAGLAPNRANLRAAVGTHSASKEERGNNLYETPVEAMRTLLALERFGPRVLEPSCGRGAIARPLEDAGYTVLLSDLVDYSTATRDGECQFVRDFIELEPIGGCPDIVTNPPYGAVLNAYVAHALRVHRPRKMALLLNLNFLCGFEDPERNFAMDDNPPARVWVFKRRLPMMHRDGWDGPEASSRMNTAWFIWERQPDGSYGDRTFITRVDWKAFETNPALGPDTARLPDGEIVWVRGDEGFAAEIDGRVIGSVDLRGDHWAWTIYGHPLEGKAQKEGAARMALAHAWLRLKAGAA